MILRFGIVCYRTVGTMFLGGCCRFSPSCSDYGMQAIRTHGSFCAIRLILQRIIRCRPLGPCGYDPVPQVGEGCCNERI